MAVTQISQIQIRYGREAELGSLASAELAWAIDTQRLFIGNGTLEEGAPIEGVTEILTINNLISSIGNSSSGGFLGNINIGGLTLGSYTFKGIWGGYEAQTGPTSNDPVIRSYQVKLDEIASVADFGAVGDGLTDDTAAIQRCIDQVYNRQGQLTPPKTRRAIEFPPGKYRITSQLRVPPYATLLAKGLDSATISQEGSGAVLFLTTAIGTDPSDAGQLGYQQPTDVYVRGLTLKSYVDHDIVKIDDATNIKFEDVKFIGSIYSPATVGTNSGAVHILSSNSATDTVTFRNCTFKNINNGARISGAVSTKNISFNGCTFTSLHTGIKTERIGIYSPSNIKVSDCVFNQIYSHGIYGAVDVDGIVSLGNTFSDVGNHYLGENSPQTPIIVFQADSNYSVADIFNRSETKDVPRVQANNKRIVSTAVDDMLRLGNSYLSPGLVVLIADGATGETILQDIDHGIINYSVKRNLETRSGVIKFASKLSNSTYNTSTNVIYENEYAETADIGVSLSIERSSGQLRIRYNSTSTGYNSYLTYDVKTLH